MQVQILEMENNEYSFAWKTTNHQTIKRYEPSSLGMKTRETERQHENVMHCDEDPVHVKDIRKGYLREKHSTNNVEAQARRPWTDAIERLTTSKVAQPKCNHVSQANEEDERNMDDAGQRICQARSVFEQQEREDGRDCPQQAQQRRKVCCRNTASCKEKEKENET